MISSQHPRILRFRTDLPRNTRIRDTVPYMQAELFIIRNPHLRKQPFQHLPEWKDFLKTTGKESIWVYFPSENLGVRMLAEKPYFEIRTARNRNLITQAEQDVYRRTTVGIAGLSVGTSIVSALARTGGPQCMKIADFDTLDPTNLNRIRAGIADIGTPKIELMAREIWGLDPFADLKLYPKGLDEKLLTKFILGVPKLDIMIDEMDNLPLKVETRLIAKKNRIPVLMVTDNGDGVMLDVERFDQEPRRPIFHGVIPGLSVAIAKRAVGPAWFELVGKIIGENYMPKRHRDSLKEVGRTLAGVPQLGTDATLGGAVASLAVRKIANKETLRSGKYVFDLNGSLVKKVI